jgi:hypothetical protein
VLNTEPRKVHACGPTNALTQRQVESWGSTIRAIDMAWNACLSMAETVGGKALMDWAVPV